MPDVLPAACPNAEVHQLAYGPCTAVGAAASYLVDWYYTNYSLSGRKNYDTDSCSFCAGVYFLLFYCTVLLSFHVLPVA